MRLSLLLVVLTLAITSCDKDKMDAEFNYTTFWNDHHQTSWDSTLTAQHLLGTWDYIYGYCCSEGSNQSFFSTADQKLQVRFSSSLVELIEDGELIQTSTWSLHLEDGDLFGLSVESSIQQLHGRIMFSKNMAIFNGSYRDGWDSWFERTPQ